jgi:F-type H+-transporting ATPase subunit alpha
MDLKPSEVATVLKAEIEGFQGRMQKSSVGTVLMVGDGVARVHGLDDCMMNEMLDFGNGIFGVALNLEEDNVGACCSAATARSRKATRCAPPAASSRCRPACRCAAASSTRSAAPSTARARSRSARTTAPDRRSAPTVPERQPVKEPLQTGIKAIDSMIPIGRGQRELIIGDRQTGKTALIIDTFINQKLDRRR